MNRAYSVGQINRYIQNMFTQDFLLNKISVKGEVSNCKYHTSGHIYFSLKDATGMISCVMFAGARKGLAFSMKNGDNVVVKGKVEVYERDGTYQLYAREIKLEGAGALYEKYLALKEELEDMGMFAPEYKQPIPKYIQKLGIVTAATGAAGAGGAVGDLRGDAAGHPAGDHALGHPRGGHHATPPSGRRAPEAEWVSEHASSQVASAAPDTRSDVPMRSASRSFDSMAR